MTPRKIKRYKPDVSKVPKKMQKQTAVEMRTGHFAAKRNGALFKRHLKHPPKPVGLGPVDLGLEGNAPRPLLDIDPTVHMPAQVRRAAAVANAHFGKEGHNARLFKLEHHLFAACKLVEKLWEIAHDPTENSDLRS
jgi:hypothetical protein